MRNPATETALDEERCRGEDLALSDVGGDHHLAACHLVELNQQP